MAKLLASSINAIFSLEGNTIRCRVDYSVSSEEVSEHRSIDVPLTPAQATQIKNFGASILLPAIKEYESIE